MCGIISWVKWNPFLWVLFCLLLSLCERHLMSQERQLGHHALFLCCASCNALLILLAHKAPAMQPTIYYNNCFKNNTYCFSQNLYCGQLLKYNWIHKSSPDLVTLLSSESRSTPLFVMFSLTHIKPPGDSPDWQRMKKSTKSPVQQRTIT